MVVWKEKLIMVTLFIYTFCRKGRSRRFRLTKSYKLDHLFKIVQCSLCAAHVHTYVYALLLQLDSIVHFMNGTYANMQETEAWR